MIGVYRRRQNRLLQWSELSLYVLLLLQTGTVVWFEFLIAGFGLLVGGLVLSYTTGFAGVGFVGLVFTLNGLPYFAGFDTRFLIMFYVCALTSRWRVKT